MKIKLLALPLLLVAIAALAVSASLLFVDLNVLLAWSREHRIAITFVLAGAMAWVISGYSLRSRQLRGRLGEFVAQHRLAPAAELSDAQEQKAAPLESLRTNLHTVHGFRWRYRQPWLLLTGDKARIDRLLPSLANSGWLTADDAVLLWCETDAGGRLDTDWLKQLGKLRRRRPIDAVVIILDGVAELPTQRRGAGIYGTTVARIANTLRWSAPVYVLDVADADEVTDLSTPVTGCEFPRGADAHSIGTALQTLRLRLADRSVGQLSRNGRDCYAGNLSKRLDTRIGPLTNWIAGLSEGRNRQRVNGAFFAPYPKPTTNRDKEDAPTSVHLPLWHHIARTARATPGRRTGLHPVTVCSVIAFAAVGLWTTGMLISAASNARDLNVTRQVLSTLTTASDPATRLRALLRLQHRIHLYETRTQNHAPLLTRFGLNHDHEVLTALWRPYAKESRNLLTTPLQQNLEASLVDLSQMQTGHLDDQTNRLALDGHKALKTYLMLARPQRADAAFMAPQLARYWSTSANLPAGEKLDLSGRLLGFYAGHLKAHEDWRIQPREDLVNSSRQTLLAVIGVKNSEDTVYQSVLDTAGNRYPDQTLASLTAGTDTRGLLRAASSVPGVFTRQAYEGTIAAAIDEAARRNEAASDWVLADGTQQPQGPQQPQQPPEQSADAMKASLASRYFTDYAEHWQGFMNSLKWEPAPALPVAIGQLKLIADARQSPVIALIKSLEYQGGAGALKASLSDTLVDKAQHVFSREAEGPEAAKPDPAGPLGASFGPVLRLVAQGSANPAASGDLSLQRFMERVTTLRLRLQQISDSPDSDAQARQVAQSLFQGKGSELADTQVYAQLIAASLGAQWAGMGDALFVRPVAQATQTVLQPAQASLNEAWRQTVLATWNRSFAGRYPFANTDNDASLPELARFLRPQGGLIGAFLGSQLAGVLELQGDQWVPVITGNTALSFDPDFLKALNTLQRVAGHLLAQGEPQYRFDFKPVPTAGVTDTIFTLDGQSLHYFNQQETWQALTWPSNNPQGPGTCLQWQTESAGTNKSFEFGGRWGLVRMLERARVQPIDSATYQLTWQARPDTMPLRAAGALKATSAASGPKVASADRDDKDNEVDADAGTQRLDSLTVQGPLTPASTDLTYPLSFMMRTEVGKGPLELLALRNFVLPARIFAGGANGTMATPGAKKTAQANGPPPLPHAMLDAAKHAEVPLPGGAGPL
ncbi:ImcF-related family protein [Paraburkholderia sp. BL25I1N1]|uniref:ImcF-related family protein n=1 Tax=Paraburkholderia sp. BL25I1N1 TaxID=1938804 RepID=UPI000D073047|nr:ImcF-related family protein [Paraburkholderia sp. BL25I1N1]PRY06564.1 type VI secretion system protein ImpL [Paraburkholderia sp. BL25I1N1]